MAAADAALPTRVTTDHGLVGALSLLERDGYYVGLRITQGLLTDLLLRIESATCYGDAESDVPFQAERRVQAEQHYQRVFQRGSYLHQPETWPEFQALREDPGILALATNYLGCAPVYLHSEVAWTYPRSVDSERPLGTPPPFKCEIQGFRSLAFSFYLTDVGAGDGPHTYIKKTRTGVPSRISYSADTARDSRRNTSRARTAQADGDRVRTARPRIRG